MSLIDLFWNFSQEQTLDELVTAQNRAKGLAGRDAAEIERLRTENQALQLRLGILIRMLIERGVFSAEEYATLLQQTASKLAAASRSQS